jgi:hypothetical protein
MKEDVIRSFGEYEIEAYREEVGILSEDLARTDINPYFEEDE